MIRVKLKLLSVTKLNKRFGKCVFYFVILNEFKISNIFYFQLLIALKC